MEPNSQNFESERKRSATKTSINTTKTAATKQQNLEDNDDENLDRPSYCSLTQCSSTIGDTSELTPRTSRHSSQTTIKRTKQQQQQQRGHRRHKSDELTLTEGEELEVIYDENSANEAKSELLNSKRASTAKKKRTTTLQSNSVQDTNRQEIGKKLKEELSKYKQELKEYNDTTKDLEAKYMKINYELNEMQQKHNKFIAKRAMARAQMADGDSSNYDSNTSIVSSAERVCNKKSSNRLFSRNTSFMTVLAMSSAEDLQELQKLRKYTNNGGSGNCLKNAMYKPPSSSGSSLNSKVSGGSSGGGGISKMRQIGSKQTQQRYIKRRRPFDELSLNQENDPPNENNKDVYSVLKDVIHNSQQQKPTRLGAGGIIESDGLELNELYSAISSLKSEQLQFRNIIRQQQDCIKDYHTRCVKAQEIMKTQKQEIEKLNCNNKHLESSIYHDIDALRSKIDAKLKNVSHLPQLMRDEHNKYEKVMRENCLLAEKLHCLQSEAAQLKIKIDDLGRRKLVTINRLKAAERDLKIFKNYNTALKTEKRRLSEELSKVREQLESLQTVNKRQMARHRDQSEKQRRELQKRIFDLELKLSRSQNSTTSLIQERDSLIAELQTQLHTLVHNFEVSQKHIRVLRRHIYSMTSTSTALGGGGGGGGVGAVASGGNTLGSAIGSANMSGSQQSNASNNFHKTCVQSNPGRMVNTLARGGGVKIPLQLKTS